MDWHVYIASCQREGGICHYIMDDTGKCHFTSFFPVDRPMYMTISDNRMYVILRDPWDTGNSGVVSFDLDDSGFLRNPSSVQSTKGSVACHILADQGDVFCANYLSGSVIKMPDTVVQHMGSSIHKERQEMSHPHFVGLTPDRKYVCVTDLGTDAIYLYDRDMKLHSRIPCPAGHGIRHLAFHGSGDYLFSANELASTVSVYSYHDGQLKLLNTSSAVPDSYNGETYAAAIRVRNNEIFVSNRGHDSIAIMKFENGCTVLKDTIDCHGKTPRDIQFTDKYLLSANQDSDTVVVMNMDEDYCVTDVLKIKTPLCICVCKSARDLGDAK